jgi:hypothetical protein
MAVTRTSFPSLPDDVVLEIMRLRTECHYGPDRISMMTGVAVSTIKNYLYGRSRVGLTGGPLKLADKEASRWRGGRKSFQQLLREGKA